MDLKVYYQKIRELERSFEDRFPVIVSLETSDGGKAGVKTEAPGHIAARMIVEGYARIATAEEAKEFIEKKSDAKRATDQAESSKQKQVSVVAEPKRK